MVEVVIVLIGTDDIKCKVDYIEQDWRKKIMCSERKLNLKDGDSAYIRSNANRGLKIALENTDEWI